MFSFLTSLPAHRSSRARSPQPQQSCLIHANYPQAARAGCSEQLLSRKQTPYDDGERAQCYSLSGPLSLSLAHLGEAFVLSDKLEPFRSAGATSLSFALAATAAAASAAEAAAAAAQLSTSFQFAVTSQSLRSSSSSAFAVVCIVLRSVQLRLVATGKASCRSRFALSSCASGDRSTTFSARVPLAIRL